MTPNELKDWRKTANMTQGQAADVLGYGLAQYKNLELGHTEIRPSLAYACAAIYHRVKPWPDCK